MIRKMNVRVVINRQNAEAVRSSSRTACWRSLRP